MVMPPIKKKMCVVKRAMERMPSPNPEIQIDIVQCEANEYCKPIPSEEKGGMPTSIELG